MYTFRNLLRPLGIKLTVFIGTLGLAPILPGVTVEFEQLTRNPAAYEGRRVCVTGVTEGDGINFALFRPPHLRQSHRVILVVNTREPRYNPVDGHWVKVCGTVTADERRYFACKLVLESADALHKRPIPGHRIFGVFENEGPQTVQIELINKTGDGGTIMTLRPGDIEKTVIVEGKVRILAVTNDLSPTEMLSSHVVPTVKSAPNYFEKPTRAFYCSVRDGKMSLLEPNKAAGMRKHWEVLEKSDRQR